uniref:Uncharacterized protein n=1 Tax=Opuntia streptacantha TaxID=393608 RepID=A0A7C9EYR6_OPUST
MRHSGFFLCIVSPGITSVSISSFFIPSGNSQSKEYNKLASVSSTVDKPRNMPGHALFPAPKGINSKFCPLKPTELSMNLSGMNTSGFFQYLGSRPTAHAFTNTKL